MRRLTALLALFMVSALIGGNADAATTSVSRAGDGFVKHQGTNWVWFGPRNWDAYYSAYGITIFAPANDGSSIDYGGATIFCDGKPKQHFAGQRSSFAANPSLKQVRFRKVSDVKRTGGTYSQTMKFTAKASGTKIGGTLGFQYAASLDNLCYGASLYRAAIDDRNFNSSMKTINRVWDGTAYNGPGLVINPNTGLP